MVALTSSAMRFKSRIRTPENWLISFAYCFEKLHELCAGHAEHRRFKKGTDLKQNFFHLVGTLFRTEMTNVKQSVRIYNICCEFMVLHSCAML